MKNEFKRWKFWIIIFAFIAMLFITGFFYLQITVQNKIRSNLHSFFGDSEVHYSSIQTSLLTSSVVINNLKIAQGSVYKNADKDQKLFFPKIELKGINVLKFIFRKELSIQKLTIENPDIKTDSSYFVAKKDWLINHVNSKKFTFTTIHIAHIEFQNLILKYDPGKEVKLSLAANFTIQNLRIDHLDKNIVGNDVQYGGFDGSFTNVRYYIIKSGQSLFIKNIIMSAKEESIKIDSLSIMPLKENYVGNPGGSPHYYLEVLLPQVTCIKADLSLLALQKLPIEMLVVQNSKISLSVSTINLTDNYLFLNDYLKSLPLQISIKDMLLNETAISYKNEISSLRFKGNIFFHLLNVYPPLNKNQLPFSGMDFKIHDFNASIKHNITNFVVKEAEWNSSKKLLLIHSLKIQPVYGKFEFSRKIGFQTDRIEALVPELGMAGLDFNQLFHGKCISEEISINKMNVSIFRDRRLPRKITEQPLPVSFLKNLPMEIRVTRLNIKNSNIVYEEFPKSGPTIGFLKFERINLSLAPLINHPLKNDPSQMKLSIEASLMGSGLVHASLFMPLTSSDYQISGAFKNVDLTSLNPASENLGNLRIKSGYLDSLGFRFGFNNYKSGGKIVGIYHHLIVQQLKADRNNQKKVAHFRSFLLRHLIIPQNKDENLPEGKRTGVIDYMRDPSRQISYYLLQSLLKGIKASFKLGFLLP